MINFVQFALVQVPSITVLRYRWSGYERPVLYNPHLEPAMGFLVAAHWRR